MISAVDTNVLLDLLIPDSRFRPQSRKSLDKAFQQGGLILSEVVYAELAARFPSRELLDRFLADTQIRLVHSSEEALHQAGRRWAEHLKRRRPLRTRILGDFLIAGHASVHADVLVSRARGFYRAYFQGLTVEDPSAG